MALVIPDDLQAFLRGRKQLKYDASECEPGQIKLLSLSKLAESEIWINARPAKDPQGDPHAGEEGYYAIPAVNLVADAEGYEPEYILLWLFPPNERLVEPCRDGNDRPGPIQNVGKMSCA